MHRNQFPCENDIGSIGYVFGYQILYVYLENDHDLRITGKQLVTWLPLVK